MASRTSADSTAGSGKRGMSNGTRNRAATTAPTTSVSVLTRSAWRVSHPLRSPARDEPKKVECDEIPLVDRVPRGISSHSTEGRQLGDVLGVGLPARHDRSGAAGATFGRVALGRAGLVVLLLDVDLPDVVRHAVGDGLHREHRGVHRVVLVVVLVHAVAADRVDVRRVGVEPATEHVDVLAVVLVVDRISLGDADDVAGLDVLRLHDAELLELPLAELDEVVVAPRPQVVALVDEVLETEAGAPVLDEVRRPGAEVLDPADAHVR